MTNFKIIPQLKNLLSLLRALYLLQLFNRIRHVVKISALTVFANLAFTNHCLAFDLDAGANALLNPMVEVIGAHFGKAVLASCAAGALVAQGDMRTRAIGAGIGGLLAGGMLGGVKAIYGI